MPDQYDGDARGGCLLQRLHSLQGISRLVFRVAKQLRELRPSIDHQQL